MESTDADIDELMLLNPHLKDISIFGCKNTTTLTAKTILETCGTYLQAL